MKYHSVTVIIPLSCRCHRYYGPFSSSSTNKTFTTSVHFVTITNLLLFFFIAIVHSVYHLIHQFILYIILLLEDSTKISAFFADLNSLIQLLSIKAKLTFY